MKRRYIFILNLKSVSPAVSSIKTKVGKIDYITLSCAQTKLFRGYLNLFPSSFDRGLSSQISQPFILADYNEWEETLHHENKFLLELYYSKGN